MRRNAFTLPEVTMIVLTLAATALPVLVRARNDANDNRTCQMMLKQIALGVFQYAQDYDGRHPLVKSNRGGWMELLMPYTKSTHIFQCPSESSGSKAGTSDYFYNARLAIHEQSKLKFASVTVMLGDGIGESPTNFSLTQLPSSWLQDNNSPAWRHWDGANYAYADGHVAVTTPERITNAPPANGISTFAPW